MLVNPYEAPLNSQAVEQLPSNRRGNWFGRFEIFVACEFAVLLLAALVHRFQLDSLDAYRTSPLIAMEVFGVLGALVIIPVALGRSLYLAVDRRFGQAILDLSICPVAFAVIAAAASIDAPTLVYAT